MMRNRTKPLLLAIMVILCLGAFILEAQTKIIRRAIDDTVYDSRNHYLPCEKLPTETEVRKVVDEHKEIIQQIERVNPGGAGVEIDTSCPRKAHLVIWHASHQNRLAMMKVIAGEVFYAVPYRLQNQ